MKRLSKGRLHSCLVRLETELCSQKANSEMIKEVLLPNINLSQTDGGSPQLQLATSIVSCPLM
jgi:hypothetical protein